MTRKRDYTVSSGNVFADLELPKPEEFLAKAEKMTALSCGGLKRKIERYVKDRYDACMVRQRLFDYDERKTVRGLRLSRAATAAR